MNNDKLIEQIPQFLMTGRTSHLQLPLIPRSFDINLVNLDLVGDFLARKKTGHKKNYGPYR